MKKELRTAVYQKYNGHCAYCGKPISIFSMQVDHIHPKRNGGNDDINNLNPSCRSCNHYKRAQDLESFRQYMLTLHERIQKDYITKVGMDFGIVRIEPFGGKFHFELQADHYQISEEAKLNGKE